MTGAGETIEVDADTEGAGWDVLLGLDLVAGLLLSAVVILAVADGVAAIWPVVGRTGPFSPPLSARLNLGLDWATPEVGLMLLGAVALFSLPRLAWTAPTDFRVARRLGRLLLASFLVAGITALAAVTAAVIAIWQPGAGSRGLLLYEVPTVAIRVVGFGLAGAACMLSVLADRSELFGYDGGEDDAEGDDSV